MIKEQKITFIVDRHALYISSHEELQVSPKSCVLSISLEVRNGGSL